MNTTTLGNRWQMVRSSEDWCIFYIVGVVLEVSASTDRYDMLVMHGEAVVGRKLQRSVDEILPAMFSASMGKVIYSTSVPHVNLHS